MGFSVDLFEAFIGDVGVDFGGGDLGMTQEFLDSAKVSSIREKVRGKGVAKDMRSDALI